MLWQRHKGLGHFHVMLFFVLGSKSVRRMGITLESLATNTWPAVPGFLFVAIGNPVVEPFEHFIFMEKCI